MLRRVVLAYRHHLEHPGILIVYRVKTPLSPHIQSRWATSAAFAIRRVPPRPSVIGSTTIPRGASSSTSPRENERAQRSHPIFQSFSASILAEIQTLLSNNASQEAILASIRRDSVILAIFTDREKLRLLAEYLAGSQSPNHSIRALCLAHTLGCPSKQNVYECVCRQLARKRSWRLLLRVVNLGKAHLGRSSARLLNWRARALAETQHYAMLQAIFKEFKLNKQVPSRRTYHLVLSSHIQNCDLEGAKECLQWMEQSGFPVDATTHALIATYYRPFGADPQVQKGALESLPGLRPAVRTAVVNQLIRICLDGNDLTTASQLLTLFDREAVRTISEVIFADNKVSGGITSSLLRSSRPHPSSLTPNATTFAVFINFQTTRSDIQGSLQIFHSMVSMGITPNTGAITALVHAYFAVGKKEVATGLVSRMCDASKIPLSYFSSLGAISTDLPFNPSGISPNAQVFNALLKGVLPEHRLEAVPTIFRIMHAHGVKPNARTLEIILRHIRHVEHGNPRTLIRLLRRISSPSLRPTLRQLQVILSCILRSEKYQLYGSGWETSAMRIAGKLSNQRTIGEDRLIGVKEPFDPLAGADLPKHLSYRGLAKPILQSLSAREVKVDSVSISMRIRNDAVATGDMTSARDIFRTLLVRGMHPNEYHFSALMEGYAQRGEIAAALDVLKSAERVGVKPNVVMFTIIIVGYARQGKPDLAIRLFQQMVDTGIKPDVASIDAVSGAFYAAGAPDMAKTVLISLWPHIQSFPQELRGLPVKKLASHFRTLRTSGVPPERVLTKQERLSLHLKTVDIARKWKYINGTRRRLQLHPYHKKI